MKILTLVLLLLPFAVYAEPVDMLDFQINELTRRRDELRAEIERCKKNTKKFKIAGVSTLGATGVGVVGNIALHNKIKNMGVGGAGGGGGMGLPKNNMSKAEKDEDFCNQLTPEEKAVIPDCNN